MKTWKLSTRSFRNECDYKLVVGLSLSGDSYAARMSVDQPTAAAAVEVRTNVNRWIINVGANQYRNERSLASAGVGFCGSEVGLNESWLSGNLQSNEHVILNAMAKESFFGGSPFDIIFDNESEIIIWLSTFNQIIIAFARPVLVKYAYQ